MYKLIVLALFSVSMACIPLQKKKVVLFGDSITELGVKPGGYISLLDSMTKNGKPANAFEFIGAGIGGNKVYDLYLRMEEDVLQKKPDVVVIFIGVNDVWHKRLLGTGTDPDKFEKFYHAIISKLQAQKIQVILCTPAVIGEKSDFTNPMDGDMNLYSSIIRKIARDHHLELVDLRKIFLDYEQKFNPENKEQGILTYDKVHLNKTGNQVVATAIWEALQPN